MPCFLPTFGNPDSKVNRTTTKKNDQAFSIRKPKATESPQNKPSWTGEAACASQRNSSLVVMGELDTGQAPSSMGLHLEPMSPFVKTSVYPVLRRQRRQEQWPCPRKAITMFHLASLCLLLLCILSQKTLNDDPAGLGGQTSPDKGIINQGVQVCSRLRAGHFTRSPAFPFSG